MSVSNPTPRPALWTRSRLSPIRRTPVRLATAMLLLIAALAAPAATGALPPVLTADRAWSRATPPTATVAAAYLTLDNRGRKPDRLLSVSSPRAARVEVHAIVHEGNVAKMRRVDPLHVAAGEKLTLEPGGIHIMLMGLASPLVAGERVPLLLRFEVAGDVPVEALVLAASDAESGHDKHH